MEEGLIVVVVMTAGRNFDAYIFTTIRIITIIHPSPPAPHLCTTITSITPPFPSYSPLLVVVGLIVFLALVYSSWEVSPPHPTPLSLSE